MIKTGLVDDHAIVRMALRDYLSMQEGIRVAGEAADGTQALKLVKSTPLDVLVMDLSMKGVSGIEALPLIRGAAPSLGILILSVLPEEQYAASMIRQGANGYLSKTCDMAQLAHAVRCVAQGLRVVSAPVAEWLRKNPPQSMGRPSHDQLSPRELQVFLRLARGQKLGAVSRELELSVKTISTFRARIKTKLGLASNTEITRYAMARGLIE